MTKIVGEGTAVEALWSVYKLIRKQSIDEAIDVLFKHVEELLIAKDFKQCDDFLKEVDLKQLDSNLIVTLLSITRAAKEHLPYRATFLTHARARLMELVAGTSGAAP